MTRGIVRVAVDVRRRLLSEREELRIARTLHAAAGAVRENVQDGRQLRTDGFFEAPSGHRPPIDELGEGVLLAAQREFQERKLPHLGCLLANIAFDERVSRYDAVLLLDVADELSWRQYCLLALFGRSERRPDLDYGAMSETERHAVSIELYGLESRELISDPMGNVTIGLPDPGTAYMLKGMGQQLFDLLQLGQLELAEIEGVLRPGRRHGV